MKLIAALLFTLASAHLVFAARSPVLPRVCKTIGVDEALVPGTRLFDETGLVAIQALGSRAEFLEAMFQRADSVELHFEVYCIADHVFLKWYADDDTGIHLVELQVQLDAKRHPTSVVSTWKRKPLPPPPPTLPAFESHIDLPPSKEK